MIISVQPKCKTCGKLMSEWNPFAEDHEHPQCLAERISQNLMKIVYECVICDHSGGNVLPKTKWR